MGWGLAEAKLATLLAIAVLAFIVTDPYWLGGLMLLQGIAWFHAGLGFAALLRIMRRLSILFIVIAISYGFFAQVTGADDWHLLTLFGVTVAINLTGLGFAAIMAMRVMLLVTASAWVQRTGTADAFVQALRRFGMPAGLALSVDATLRLAAGGGTGGGGGGKGQGGGRHRGGGQDAPTISFKDIREKRLGLVTELVEQALARAQTHIAQVNPGLTATRARDIAIIVGIASAIIGLKAFQVMPGLPIAPGHKNLIIIPFFLLAAGLTKTPWGGFLTGTTVGIVSVMLGFGKFGILEIAHFAVPGLLADLLLPLARLGAPRWLRVIQFAAIGGLMGLGRFGANFLVIVLAGAPGAAFVFYLPMLASQVAFGAASAMVSLVVLALLSRKDESALSQGADPETHDEGPIDSDDDRRADKGSGQGTGDGSGGGDGRGGGRGDRRPAV